MNDVPPTPSKSRGRNTRTPVPVNNLESVKEKEISPLPLLPGLNFCSNHNHGLSLPVLHGALGTGGSVGSGASRPTLLERRTRTGMSMSCLSGLSMDTIHETSRDNGVQQVSTGHVPPATFRGWSNDTADAVLIERQATAALPSTSESAVKRRAVTAAATPGSTSAGPMPLATGAGASGAPRKEVKRSATGFSLVSYNILAARLVTTDRYPDCPPIALGEDYRLKLIREELDLTKADLIALQEISVEAFEKEDGLGGFLRHERDYDGEFAVITGKTGADRCDVRKRLREEKTPAPAPPPVPTKPTLVPAEVMVPLSSTMLPALPLSRRESRTGSCATAATTNSDDTMPNMGTPVHRDRSSTVPEAMTSTTGTPLAVPTRPLSSSTRAVPGGGRSPLTRKPPPLTSGAPPLKPGAAKGVSAVPPTLALDLTSAAGDGSIGGSSGPGTGTTASPLQVRDAPPPPRRTEMDGLAIFWSKTRFERLETCCLRFNELAAADTGLSPYERKKLQVDSHNVALVCVLREITNPASIVILGTVHLIWQRVEAQLWQTNELVKVLECLTRKYGSAPGSAPRGISPLNPSLNPSRCSRSMPVTLSAPASQPLLCRRQQSPQLQQSDAHFNPRRETSSASFSRIGAGMAESPTASAAPLLTCLLAGDFNAEPTNPVVQFLTTGRVPEAAETMHSWRKPSVDTVSPSDRSGEEEGPTVSSVVPLEDAHASSGVFGPIRTGPPRLDREPPELSWPPDPSYEGSDSLSAPPPPCKNWSRKRTANPTVPIASENTPTTALPVPTGSGAAVGAAGTATALGPCTPPRDGRSEAYRGRRLDAESKARDGTHLTEETVLTTRGLPHFDDLQGVPPSCVEVVPLDDNSFADQPETDRFCTSKALSELSAVADPKHTLFVPALLADRSIVDSLTTPSGHTTNASPTVVASPVIARLSRPLADSNVMNSDGDGSALRMTSSIGSPPQPMDADGWFCEVGSSNGERDQPSRSPLAPPFQLPQSKRAPTKLRASLTSPAIEASASDTAPTHGLRLKDAYERYRAHNPRLVSAVNPSTNTEGKVLDHIFFQSDQFLCQSVLKLGELVDLPNIFFPSDHYMVGAVFVPGRPSSANEA